LETDLEKRKALFQRMAAKGFFLLSVPKQQEQKANTLAYSLALAVISKVDAGIGVTMAVTNMVAESIYRFGTEEQKKKYLDLLKTGAGAPASFALTEKNSGSDAKSIQTRATVDPNDSHYYILEGEKQFITNGDLAGITIVLAKTGVGNNGSDITAFLIEKGTPGVSVSKIERKLGLLTANLVGLCFDKCRVSERQILGKVGDGFDIAMKSLDSGRIGVAAQAVGIAEAAYEAAVKFAKERIQFGHPIGDNQAIAFKLADMKVKLEASKLLLYQACWTKDHAETYTVEASEAKLFCSETCNQIAADALQIHGGYGYIKDYPVEKYYRDARVTTLYEGTSEIQRIVISRHGIGLNRI